MGLTYDGITYRSLEEQVRYDAEQVQLLKQADVTINENLQTMNENLQTVNTEIDGKLTKPANPSAESAVTMLADGTVGTKPLSEIGGGGGGKLYMHSIHIGAINNLSLGIVLYKSDNSEINTIDKLFDVLIPGIPCHYTGNQGSGFVEVSMTGQPGVHAMTLIGVVVNSSNQVSAVNVSNVNATIIRDSVIEV